MILSVKEKKYKSGYGKKESMNQMYFGETGVSKLSA
jgi:hypothetical protein